MRRHYLVSYDISDPVRLRRVHRVVRDFGDGVQLSVFTCQLSRKDLAVLEARLLDVIDQRRDQVIVLDLGQALESDDAPDGLRTLGRPLTPGIVRGWVI
jgi:CRISPR-associated protein Cas2